MLRNERLLQEEQIQPVFSAGTIGVASVERRNIMNMLLLTPRMKESI